MGNMHVAITQLMRIGFSIADLQATLKMAILRTQLKDEEERVIKPERPLDPARTY